jgi:hypothetical protein
LTLIAAKQSGRWSAARHRTRAARDTAQIVTRGIDGGELGKRFRIGDVECRGRLCGLRTLQAMTKPGVAQGLAHRGGLNADILSDGAIQPR